MVPESPETLTVSWTALGVVVASATAIFTALSALIRIGQLIQTLESLRGEVSALRQEVAALRAENVDLNKALSHLQGSLGE